ncbi:tRNA (adenosine(37)-N6)-dimethylallyltransferase MiaA [Paenibacillus beijingensis]|uniref:tRNA dimethylallyltransferase n=1 Tax=Paenibacillus beijingensis TaxID=1126833 RepID=A0A0D5NRT1_9BACL|nr:tRNA (adenosine(37)-N6)-dimethylallyltransferase MiaA [Paenibacillus beijingensis]AJY77996.1 tRNA delta(2)-isopentenylpyrophosphate transferase [Paenibacillus beijingensis]
MAAENRKAAGDKPRLLVLIGPTAIGKTELSLTLAKSLNAEIISGDSMQVYRGMNIGTAKIPEEQRQGIPHHLIDIRDPEEPYSAADFQEACTSLIADITARGNLPFIVGGTGLYIESVCYGYRFSEASADEAFREEQQRYADTYGPEALHAKLGAVDPESAERLHPNDTRRIIRALEVHHLTGETKSAHLAGQKKESPYEVCIIGLAMDRAKLYRRIEQRVDLMLEQGLVQEVEELLRTGVSTSAVAMQGLGYKEMIPYLEGERTLEESVALLKRDTRRFAKRQLSWFRHMDNIHWIEAEQNLDKKLQLIHAIIAGKF